MIIERTKEPGVVLYTPDVYADERGFFTEACNYHYNFIPKQCNYSSSNKGAIRGLHYQPGLAKLVWVVRGSVYDVAFNLKTGTHYAITLSADNHQQLLVPDGYAHGMQALEDNTIICYLMSDYYDPITDAGINPLQAGVDWPLRKQILSEKDSNAREFFYKSGTTGLATY